MIQLPTAKQARRITLGKKKRLKELLFIVLAEAIDEGKCNTWVGYRSKEKAHKAKKRLEKLNYLCEIENISYQHMPKKMCKYRLKIAW